MKVVIFCGGLGIRMGDMTRSIPKPMITVDGEPILSHIMRWYASWGHSDFGLCLGYRANLIAEYFADRPEGWRITCLDTGIRASIADRLRSARDYVGDDEVFLCTYGDGLTDAPLDLMVDRLEASEATGLFISVRPRLSYHFVQAAADGTVRSIAPIETTDIRINGGYFVFRREIFDYLEPGLDIMDVAARLAQAGELVAYRHDGFWAAMDTMRDKQDLDAIAAAGDPPWLVSGKLEAA